MRNNAFVELEAWVKNTVALSGEISVGWQDILGEKISQYLSLTASKIDQLGEDASYFLRQLADCEKLCYEILDINEDEGEQMVLSKRR